jgi:RHS repeat-associated protein
LLSAVTPSLSCSRISQNYTYAYDRYGNRVSQTPLQGGYTFDPTINASNNHITTSGYTYDAAGNMTSDTVHSYTYDAEGNITKVDGGTTAQYVYDVFNHRVHVQTASATNEYIYDYAGRRVSTWLSPSNYGSEGRIYWGGQQFAYRSTDGTTYFDHQDMLGTERMRTNYAGSVGSSYVSLPWGDGFTATVNASGADQDNEHFAGLERDAESGTEHAQFRNYASAQGRWLAPDPYTGSYDLTNPQSMNRYAYALNNPTSMLDPSGLDPVCSVDPDTGLLECTSYYSGDGPSDPVGCISSGTQGCIPTNCASPYGCDGPPPPGTQSTGGGGGSLGPLRTAILSNAPNNGCTAQRLYSGVMGAANVGLAISKGFALGGAVAGFGATGAGAPAAAVLGVYGTVSIFGQGLTGAAQLYSAVTGNYGTPGRVAQIGNILSGPVSGLGTLVQGGSLAAAEQNAGYESLFTAGSGLIDAIRTAGNIPLAAADHSAAYFGAFANGGNACGAGH